MIREIVKYPHPILTRPAADVVTITSEIRQLVDDIAETMYAMGGVGIAAPQVGVSSRLFIIIPELAGLPKSAPPMVFINSEVVRTGGPVESHQEGCLSFPGVFTFVPRPSTVEIKALDIEGREFLVEARALFARALLHEHEHTTGNLLYDHAGQMERARMRRCLEKRR